MITIPNQDWQQLAAGRHADPELFFPVCSFLTEIALGATYHQAADVGEVLSTVERIRNGHAQSWVDEWTATADRLSIEGRPQRRRQSLAVRCPAVPACVDVLLAGKLLGGRDR
jgi:hypothetical protein